MLVFHLASIAMSRHHFHGPHDCFCAFRRTSNRIWASRRVAQDHLGITRHAQQELVQISSFLMFFCKVVIRRMGPGPTCGQEQLKRRTRARNFFWEKSKKRFGPLLMSSGRLVLFSGESEHFFFVKNVGQKIKKKILKNSNGWNI